MNKLQLFLETFYKKLNASIDHFATCRIKLKHYLSQLHYQYGDFIQEQESQYLNQLSEENDSFLSIENDRSITTEYNEMKYFRKLSDFIRKLKKQNLQSHYLPNSSPQLGKLSRDRLLEILSQEVNDLIYMSQLIHPYSGIHEQLKQIEQQINQLKQIKQIEDSIQLKCPLKEPHQVSQKVANLLSSQDEQFFTELQNDGFHVLRISQVFYFQRYLLSYQLRSSLFGLELPPGFVIRLTLSRKPKRYQYYFITQTIQNEQLKKTKNEFAKHFLSLFVTDHLDHLVPKYYGDLKVFYGNAPQQQITQYEQFKNPLFHFKKDIFETSYDIQEFDEIKPHDVMAGFLSFLDFVNSTLIYDFNYYSKGNSDKIKSLNINSEVIQVTFKRIKKLQDTLIYIQEVLFPQHFNVRLIQLTQLLNPLFFQFMRLETSKFQTLNEYEDFISKLNLEEVMHKLIDGQLLIKYNNQLREIKQDDVKANSQEKIPSQALLEFFYRLNIQYDISLLNRIKIIDYLAKINFYQLDTQFLSHSEDIYNNVIANFNKSWFDCELWKQAFQANYKVALGSSQFSNTFLVELLAIHFIGNQFSELNINLFESISEIDETDENCYKIILYLMNKKLRGINNLGKVSIAESSLKYQKFNLLLKLLSIDDGKKIRNEFFDYLVEDQGDNQKYHSYIFLEVEKSYPHLVNRLKWNYFWNQLSKQQGENQFNVLYKRPIKFTADQYHEIFSNNLLKNQHDLPTYLEVNLNSIINQNHDKHFALLQIGDKSLLFMQPNFPLLKFMACQLYKLLSLDQFISNIEIATHKSQIYSIYEVINTLIEGQRIRFTVAQYLLHHHFNEQNLRLKIGNQNLAYKILLSILLLPSNITPDQELLVPCGNFFAPVTTNFYFDPKYDNLINICGFEREGDKVQLCCKNIYFLTQFMNEKIDPKYLIPFQNLTVILQQWLKQMSQIELKIEKTQSIMILPLNKENMIALVHRATLIQQAKNTQTYLDLLKQCDSNLGEYYQSLINNCGLNLIQKYNELNNVMPISLTRQDYSSFRESFASQKYPSNFQLRNSIGPSKGLKMILKYTRLLTEGEEFSKKLEIIKKPYHFQLLVNSIDWKSLKETQVASILESLIKYSKDYNQPFEYINFNNLSHRSFQQLFLQFELIRIKILDLSNIDTITDVFINDICYKCSELHVLNISGCSGLIYLGSQKRLQFLRLKTLIASDLPNLRSIEMSGQFLQNLNVNYCPQLLSIYTLNQLNKIQVKGCKLLQQEIVEMWILQGIQVLLDDHTSNGAFQQIANKKIIRVNEDQSLQRDYIEIIFHLLGEIYEKFIFTDQNSRSPLPNYLVKSGIVVEDQSNQFLTFLSKQLDEKSKKPYIYGVFQSLFKNQNIHTLDLQSLIVQKSEDKRKFLDQFLDDFNHVIESSIGQELFQPNQIVKQFFKNIEWITIPSTSESVQEKVCQLLQILSYYRQFIKVSFANLKSIKSTTIEKYFQNFQQSEKYLYIPSFDFSGNSLTIENINEIFYEGIFSLINIQYLNLSNAGIDDNMLNSICDKFWNCENLKYLDLSKNQISSEGLNQLLKAGLEKESIMTPLNSLNISHNNLGDATFEILFQIEQKFWQNKENQLMCLKNLTMQKCFKKNQNIESFCKFISQSYNLQILDLRQNEFNDDAIQCLSKSIGCSKSIQSMFFQNEIKTIQTLNFEEIIKSNTLSIMNLFAACFYEEFQFIFEKLTSLYLTLPTIQENNLHTLTKLYSQNQTLLYFDLHILDEEVKERTYFKLEQSKIIALKEKKEHKEIMQSEKFVKQDTLRIDISDYSYTGLSLDGGGMRGLMPATIVNYLCTEMKKEPYQLFDCIGGTSIGGMLALTMVGTKDGHTPLVNKDGLIKLFTEEGKTIFEDSKRGVWNIMSKSKYDAKGIENVLSRHCGTVKLSETIQNTNVIVTAVKLQKQRGETVAKVFSSRKAKVDLTENFLMKDVGRATSAAPTYFPAAQIKSLAGKEYQFIDGGIGVNNPSNFVLEDLRKCMLNREQDNFFLLSLSTGLAKQKQSLQVDEGLLSVGKIIDAFGESNQDFVDLELKRYEGKYLRIIPEYDLQESLAQMDNTDPKVFEEYQQSALVAAETYFNKEIFGRYQDKSFIRWLDENTARRLEQK